VGTRYNSAISTSIVQLGYPTIVASESFLHGAGIGNRTEFMDLGIDPDFNIWPPTNLWDNWQAFQMTQANATNSLVFENISNKDCIEKYSNVFATRTSLVVITEDFPEDLNASVHQYIYWPAQYGGWSRYFPCDDHGNIIENDPKFKNPDCQTLTHNTQAVYDEWKKFNRTVLYCLSERSDGGHCRINYSPNIFIGSSQTLPR
jgi:hypothetical protein